MTTFPKYAETCLPIEKTHRRIYSKPRLGVLSFGDDSSVVNHDSSCMVPLPTEASINWDVNSTSSSSQVQLVEASLNWLIKAHGDHGNADSVDDEVSTSAFAKYASAYFARDATHQNRRNSKSTKGVLTIGAGSEDENAVELPLPSQASINWLG